MAELVASVGGELAGDYLWEEVLEPLGPERRRVLAVLSDLGAACGPADFHGHTSTWSEPIATTYRGARVTTHPPNSSGVVAMSFKRGNVAACDA